MTLPAGQISLSEVNVELNLSPTATISLNDAAVRSLAGVPSGQIAMSNLQGKSNNPYFFASLASDVYGYGIDIDSSSNIYQGNNLGPGASKSQVIKINNTGVIQWQRQLTSTDVDYPSVNMAGSVVNKSTGDVYAAGINSAGGTNLIHIWKYNSSGTLQWKKQIGNISNSTYIGGTGADTLALDSAGNLDFVVANLGNKVGIMQVTSSGATSLQVALNSPGGFDNPQADNITVDSSDNIIFSGYIYDSGFSMIVGKFDGYNGSALWLQRGYNSDFFGGWGRGVGTDSSNNVYVASQSASNTTTVLKYNSSGTNQWATRLGVGASGDNSPRSIAVDSSGNSYVMLGGGTEGFFVIKYNSSGTLQWQRNIVRSPSSYMNASSITLSADGTIFYINGRISATSTSLFAKLPTDGSKTGTYTLDGASYTYAASSLAVTASNLTLSSLSPNGGGFSRTNTTSSLVDSATTKTITVTNV